MTPLSAREPRTEENDMEAELFAFEVPTTAGRFRIIGPNTLPAEEAARIGTKIMRLLALLPNEPTAPTERVRDVRLLLLDSIGTELSREFAQGDPFEPFDRTYVVKTITRVLDEARERTLAAAEPSR